MAIIRWDPFREITEFNRVMNRMLAGSGQQEGWMPSVDVLDQGNAIEIKADLPGVDPDNVELDVQDNVLTIKGRREQQRETKQEQYYRLEREVGQFQRSLALPQDVKLDEIEANYSDGVLTIRAPKSEQRQPQRIQIQRQEDRQESKQLGTERQSGERAA